MFDRCHRFSVILQNWSLDPTEKAVQLPTYYLWPSTKKNNETPGWLGFLCVWLVGLVDQLLQPTQNQLINWLFCLFWTNYYSIYSVNSAPDSRILFRSFWNQDRSQKNTITVNSVYSHFGIPSPRRMHPNFLCIYFQSHDKSNPMDTGPSLLMQLKEERVMRWVTCDQAPLPLLASSLHGWFEIALETAANITSVNGPLDRCFVSGLIWFHTRQKQFTVSLSRYSNQSRITVAPESAAGLFQLFLWRTTSNISRTTFSTSNLGYKTRELESAEMSKALWRIL